MSKEDFTEARDEVNGPKFVGNRLGDGDNQAEGPGQRHVTMVEAKVVQQEKRVARYLLEKP